jgi:hypothetical protein
VVGRGGTGKSEVLRRLVARLKAAEITVHTVAFTHVAAQNAEGGTILHELHANKRQKNVAICVDEASMVSLSLWAQLAKFHFTGAMFFVFGDWAGQFQPIEDQDAPREVEYSGFLHRLCRGNRIELRKFRRHPVSGRADQGHFDFVGGIYPPTTLAEALPRARERYPVQGRPTGTVLVVTHRARVAFNAEMNARLCPDEFLEVEPGRVTLGANMPQRMRVWRGQVLMAVVGSAHRVLKNGLRYRVLELSPLRVVKIDDAGEARGEPFALPVEEAARDLRLTHALCYYSSQARTIHGPLRLAQTEHPHFTLRHLIVGLGRAPSGSEVEVE